MPIILERSIAYAAATDAGNCNMRKHGRAKWNAGDRDVAAEVFTRLWPEEIHEYIPEVIKLCASTK